MSSQSKEIGTAIETQLCQQNDWERVDGALEEPDAINDSGEPFEIKGARKTISNGEGETAGRFYLRYRAHQALIENDGSYALSVYEYADGADIEILVTEIVSAQDVDELIGDWTTVDRPGEVAVAKLSHHCFDLLPELGSGRSNGGGRDV